MVVDVAHVTRIRHLVEDEDLIVGVVSAHLVDDMGPRETGSAGDDDR